MKNTCSGNEYNMQTADAMPVRESQLKKQIQVLLTSLALPAFEVAD